MADRSLRPGHPDGLTALQYRIADDLLVRLASAPASESELALLRSGQLSKQLQLVAFLAKTLPTDVQWSSAIELLSEIQISAPQVAERLFSAPCFGSWASHCVRRLRTLPENDVPIEVEASYLQATAVVAAMQAGIDTVMTIYVRDGLVRLPTLGAVRVEAPELARVEATVTAGQIVLRVDGYDVCLPERLDKQTFGWLPIRVLSAQASGLGIEVELDDLDIYRNCYGYVIAARLSDQEVDEWAKALNEAWHLLVEQAHGLACELSLGLRSIVPLAPNRPGPELSATSATAFGALALTLPQQVDHLAATMVHEFQHSKLSALLDLLPLYDKTTDARHFAPWRAEPRPIGGLLQGCYAFLAVGGFWLRLSRSAVGGHVPERLFAELRLQVDEVMTTLERGCYLTPDGRAFLGEMRRVLDSQLAVLVSPEVDEAARRSLDRNRKAWQQRHPEALSRSYIANIPR